MIWNFSFLLALVLQLARVLTRLQRKLRHQLLIALAPKRVLWIGWDLKKAQVVSYVDMCILCEIAVTFGL